MCYVTYITSNCAETCMQMFSYSQKKTNQPKKFSRNQPPQAGWGSLNAKNTHVPSKSSLCQLSHLTKKMNPPWLGSSCNRTHCFVFQVELLQQLRFFFSCLSDENRKDLFFYCTWNVKRVVSNDWTLPIRLRAGKLFCKDWYLRGIVAATLLFHWYF